MAKKILYVIIMMSLLMNTFGILMVNAVPMETVSGSAKFSIPITDRDVIAYSDGDYYETFYGHYIYNPSSGVYNGLIYNVSGIPANATLSNAVIQFNVSIGHVEKAGLTSTIYTSDYNNIQGWNESYIFDVDFSVWRNIDFSYITAGEVVNSTNLIALMAHTKSENGLSGHDGFYEFIMLSANEPTVRMFHTSDYSVLYCPQLYVEYTYQRPAVTSGVLVDDLPNGYYIVDESTEVEQINSFIKIGGGNLSQVIFNPSDWSKTYYVLPANKHYDEASPNMKLIETNNVGYYVATNLTETHLWNCSTSDRSDWSMIGEIKSNVVAKDAVLVHHIEENCIYAILIGSSTYSMSYGRYNISSQTWWSPNNASSDIYTGSIASSNVDAIYDSEYEVIYVIGSAGNPQRARMYNYTSTGGWVNEFNVAPNGGTGYGVSVELFGNYVVAFAQDAGRHYYSYKLRSGGAWSSWTVISATDSSYHASYQTSNYLYYFWSNNDADDKKDWERFDTTMTRSEGNDMNYTGYDQRLIVKTHYTNPSGVTFETMVLEVEGGASDRLILFNNPDDLRTYPTDVPFWTSRTLSTHVISGLGEVYVSGVGTTLYVLYNENCTICPIYNSTDLDDVYDFYEALQFEEDYETYFENNMGIIMVLIAIFIIIFGCGGAIQIGIVTETGFVMFIMSALTGVALIYTFLSGGF